MYNAGILALSLNSLHKKTKKMKMNGLSTQHKKLEDQQNGHGENKNIKGKSRN